MQLRKEKAKARSPAIIIVAFLVLATLLVSLSLLVFIVFLCYVLVCLQLHHQIKRYSRNKLTNFMLNECTSERTNSNTTSSHSDVLSSVALLLRLLLITTLVISTLIISSRRTGRRRIISLRLRRRHRARTIIVALTGGTGERRLPLRATCSIFNPESAAHVRLPFLVPALRHWGRGTGWGSSHGRRGAIWATLVRWAVAVGRLAVARRARRRTVVRVVVVGHFCEGFGESKRVRKREGGGRWVYVGKTMGYINIRPEPNSISTHTSACWRKKKNVVETRSVEQALCGEYSWPGPTRQRLSIYP
jgi:hypothetical protein